MRSLWSYSGYRPRRSLVALISRSPRGFHAGSDGSHSGSSLGQLSCRRSLGHCFQMPQYHIFVTFDTQEMLSVSWKTIRTCGFSAVPIRGRFSALGTCRALGRFQPIPKGSQKLSFLCVPVLVITTHHSHSFLMHPALSIGLLSGAGNFLVH
jgi:hypothetical protein